MDSSLSFKRVLAQSLFLLAPILVAAQGNGSTSLSSCLTAAGVNNIVDTAANWATETAPWQLRLKADPACVAYPADRAQLASSLSCARSNNVKVSALGGGLSFVAYGFGDPGNLVINMAAFNSLSLDEATGHYTFGGGARVGPALKYLWESAGRHFPHVRHGRVGLAGSTIGGGYGSTSRFLGTPMESIESVEYMLYNGTIVNAAANSDLLWAAKGAGSSFGIVLSMTTRTWKPTYQKVVNFTIAMGTLDIKRGAEALIAIQNYALTEGPDEIALRFSLTAPPYTATGYFYGNPIDFDKVMAPLMSRLPETAVMRKTEFEFYQMETFVATGTNLPNGGTSPGRAFYIQALTMTTDRPLTYELAYTLLESTTYAFNRSDMRKSGFIDLWGGVSRNVKDSDNALAIGKNLWLIRWEANAIVPTNWPVDGVSYLQNQMLQFENALTAQNIPLRGFANYRDSALTEVQWSQRLYGDNYPRLQSIKAAYDPEALFTSNPQSIPLP